MLLSFKELSGYEVRFKDKDNEIGKLSEFFFEPENKNWKIRYLLVEPDQEQTQKKILMSTDTLDAKPDEENKTLPLDPTKDTVKEFSDIEKDKIKKTVSNESDRPLISAEDVIGSKIQAKGGKIGEIRDFIIDDKDWVIRYVVVYRKGLLLGTETVLAADWVENLDLPKSKVQVDVSKEMIKNAPDYTPSLFNRHYEEKIYFYYEREKPKYLS